MPLLEIWDYKVIIRKPKEREQNRKKCVAPLLAACQ
jgi:hypothetical protein